MRRELPLRINGGHELKRAERCPPVAGTPLALFMELIHCLAIIYVQLSARWPCYVDKRFRNHFAIFAGGVI